MKADNRLYKVISLEIIDIMAKKQNNREKLLEYGLRVEMVDKLTDHQAINILAFAMDHHKSLEIKKMVTMAASMEVGTKPGAALLLSNKIATIMQLKNITPAQIIEVITDYQIHQDEVLAAKMIRDFIIDNQQEKLEDRGVDFTRDIRHTYEKEF